MKTTSSKKEYAYFNSPRCGAKTKRNNGSPCRAPAVKGKNRCRIHGGAKGSGAKIGNKNALKHGFTTTEAKNFKAQVKQSIKHNKL